MEVSVVSISFSYYDACSAGIDTGSGPVGAPYPVVRMLRPGVSSGEAWIIKFIKT